MAATYVLGEIIQRSFTRSVPRRGHPRGCSTAPREY